MGVMDTSLVLALAAVFDEERECESIEHGRRPEGHVGTAEWYVHTKYACGHEAVKAYCDRFKGLLFESGTVLICAECRHEQPAREVVRNATRLRA